jgi:hypothetical protein
MALIGFNVLLQLEDAVGECFVSYGVVAQDGVQAGKLAEGAALSEGFWSVSVEEVWRPEDPDAGDLGDIPEVLGRTDPTYLDEAELED